MQASKSAQATKRTSGQGFVPRQHRSRFQLALVGALSVLLSPLSIAAALAIDYGSVPVPTTFDSKFVTDLKAAQLTNATFQSFVSDYMGAYYAVKSSGTGGVNNYSAADLLALPTSDSQFYSSTTPRYYKFRFCNADPTSYFIVGNLLVQSGDLRPEAKEYWEGTDAVQPTPNVTFDLCSQPKVPFAYPTGFVASATNGNYMFVRQSFRYKRVDTTPQNTLRPTFSETPFLLALTWSNSQSQLTVPYTQQGAAVYGTDYSTDSNNGIVVTGNSVVLPAFNLSYVTVGVSAPVYFKSTNHAQLTSQWGFTAPPGYTWLGQPTWYGRINALNRSTVTVTPINSQSTLTPGSTTGGFVLNRTNGDQTQPLTVSYTIGGTAANGTDYGYLSGTATIPANQSTLNVPIFAPTPSGATAIAQKNVLISLGDPSDSSYLVPTTGVTGQSNDFIIPAYNPSTVTFAQGSGGGTLTPGQPQAFTVTRSGGDTTKALTVNYTTGGTAQPGVDYQALSGSVTIPAGSTTASVPLAAIQHTGTTAYGATTLSLTPAAGTGYDATGASAISYSIPAYTPSTVSVSAANNGGTLTPGGTGTFTVTRTGDTSQSLVIPYTTGGTAQAGTDYGTLPGSITIPAGSTTASQTFSVPLQNGSTSVPSKTLTITPQSGSSYTIDSTKSVATYTTTAYNPTSTPTVSVSIPTGQDSVLLTGTSTDGFTIARSGSTTSPLTVTYTVGGTGTSGTDYQALPGTVTIPAGATSATVPLVIPANATLGKTVAVNLSTGTGYTVGNPSVVYTIAPRAVPDIMAPTISLGFDPSLPAFVVIRTGGGLPLPLTVPIDFSGTGVPGIDYAQLPTSVTFGVEQTKVLVPVKLLPTAQTGDTITATIPPGSGYTVGSGSGTTFTVPAGYNDGSNLTTSPAAPTTTQPTTTAKKSSGNGGGLGFLAAAGGLGSIALGSGGLVGGSAAAASTVVPGLLAGSALGTIPQSCSTTGETPIQLAQLLPLLKEANPNWSGSTFGSLPAPTADGTIKLGKAAMSWKAGQPVADIVRVGDTDGTFNLHCLGLAKLASVSQLGLAAKPLSTLNLVSDTTLKGLSQSLYRRAKAVGDVKGLAQWLAAKSAGRFTAEQLSSMKLADLVKAEPALASLPMGAVPLNQLPGFADLLLGDVPGLASKSISQVAGLSKVPFSQFPTQPKPLTASAQ